MTDSPVLPGRQIFYDTEFWEAPDGRLVLLSIALVDDTGRTLELVSADAPWPAIEQSPNGPWLVEHVWPGIVGKPAYPISQIKNLVRDYLRPQQAGEAAPELWADYCAYDHVVLAQLLGTMQEWPSWLPFFTNDIQQLIALATQDCDEARLATLKSSVYERLSEVAGREHDALYDAHEARIKHSVYSRTYNARLAHSLLQPLRTTP